MERTIWIPLRLIKTTESAGFFFFCVFFSFFFFVFYFFLAVVFFFFFFLCYFCVIGFLSPLHSELLINFDGLPILNSTRGLRIGEQVTGIPADRYILFRTSQAEMAAPIQPHVCCSFSQWCVFFTSNLRRRAIAVHLNVGERPSLMNSCGG